MDKRDHYPIHEGDGIKKCKICKSYLFIELISEIINGRFGQSIECGWCSTHTLYYKTKKEAIEAWNNDNVIIGE